MRDDWFEEDDCDELGPKGYAECGCCGEWWPEDHLETDSGDCITCEDMRQLEREDET